MDIETWSVDEALAVAASLDIAALPACEPVMLADALGRALSHAVVAPIDIPARDNAAMDGIAWSHAPVVPHGGLRIAGSVLAGDRVDAIELAPGECVRIMTGAALPAACDTVTPIEQCRLDHDRVVFSSALARGAHVRRRGEDIEQGAPALPGGRRIGAAEIALLAALGIERIDVRTRLRVAVISTGKELVRAGHAPARTPGSATVFDSNAPMMLALLQAIGVQPVDGGTVDDDAPALLAAVTAAARRADVVITTGGTGGGDADHASALAQLGWLRSAHVAIKPGRPLGLGEIRLDHADAPSVPLFCLPGNPVAALVSYLMFVRVRLLAWQGIEPHPIDRFELPVSEAIDKRPGRVEVLRARYERAATGLRIAPLPQQGSGMLGSLGAADALIVLPEPRGGVAIGETVEVWPLAGLLG
ncbi:molybdopterin molybdotransferase MoeA [soil metagenome]